MYYKNQKKYKYTINKNYNLHIIQSNNYNIKYKTQKYKIKIYKIKIYKIKIYKLKQ